MNKLFRKIHLWLSVPFGIFITLICFSGAMLVFEKEITELCRPDLYFVENAAGRPLPMDSLMHKVTAQLPDSVEATGLTVSPDPERTWQVSLSKPRRASVYVDPYTGEIKGRSERLAFFDVMFHLHRWLMGDARSKDGGMSAGKLLVGVSTIVLVFILITGVVLWWPRNRQVLKNRLKISVTKGWHRFWYDMHVSAGIYATIFILAMALTGLTWSFSWYRTGFYGMFGLEAGADGGAHGGRAHGGRGDEAPGEGNHGGRNHDGRRGGRPDGRPHDGNEQDDRNGRDGQERHRHRDGDAENRHKTNETAATVDNSKADAGRPATEAEEKSPAASTAEATDAETDMTADENAGRGRHNGERRGRGERGEGGESFHNRGEGRRGHRHQQDSTGSYSGRRHHDADHASTDSTAGRHAAEADIALTTENGDRASARQQRTDDASSNAIAGTGSRNHDRNRGGRNGNRDGKRSDGRGRKAGRGDMARNTATKSDTTLIVSTGSTATADSTLMASHSEASPYAQWQGVYERLAQANPGYRQITMQDGSAGVIPEGRLSLRAADRYGFDPESGEITSTQLYRDQDKGTKARGSIYMVHVGSWGGLITRILAFLAALTGATLPLTGYYLWIRRLMNKRKR